MRVWPDWNIISVADGLVLSVCPKLNVMPLRSRDGVTYYLLGFAVLADQPMKTIAEEFPSRHSSEIEDWTGFWSGKWVLISAERVWPDATGCLGVYYREAGGALWISSSPALLGDRVPDAPSAPYIGWHIRHRTGIDWIPLPLTTRETVFKVMALRTIHPMTGALRPVHFGAAANDGKIDPQSLASAVKTIMINWGRTAFRDHYVSLTAGIDTRLILAAASAAGLAFAARTIKYAEASRADLTMPPRLAARVGVRHRLVARPHPPLPLSEVKARSAAIEQHMDGAAFHPAAAAFAHGLDDFMHDAGCIMTGGHILDMGRRMYWRRFANAGLGDALPSADQVLDAFFTRSIDPYPFWTSHPPARWREAMQLWLDSLSEPRALKLDWRDAFHLDQGAAGWESNLHRLMDLFDGVYFPPANCLWVLYLLLRGSTEDKGEVFAYNNAIRTLSPALAEIPINPPTRAQRVKRVVRQVLGEKRIRKLRSLAKFARVRR